ncbi:D-2-hydroxyacid dehydrogenase [Alkalilacustris brevis]|uniref:D-2-hydroxyacid dehydrogenase n=1 Tax=Alkalilacustris brevis TaxID=2026338 RepID=UPI0013905A4D|nr:D-2-hydroxyacid dehydrogenase [Alkalilacustris brevis]
MADKLLIFEPESAEELAHYAEVFARDLPEATIHTAHTLDEALKARDATALIAKAQLIPRELVAALPGLKWVQSLISGVDHLRPLGLPDGVLVTAARGFHGPQMAELAMMLMLALNRRLPEMLENQKACRWDHRSQPLLVNKTAVIVGLGNIAEMVADRCRAFGMTVIGVSNGRTEVPGFAQVFPRDRLPEAAALADFLIALVPYEPATHHLIGAQVFAAMKPSAYFINIARGGVADEAALITALEGGQIAGAGLDVFSSEPLPPEHPLWRTERLIITPHVGGRSDIYAQQVAPQVIENARNFIAGRPERMTHRVTL